MPSSSISAISGTKYHRFTVRTLHKYVLSAIRNKPVAGGSRGNIDYSTSDLFSRRQSASQLQQRKSAALSDGSAIGRPLFSTPHDSQRSSSSGPSTIGRDNLIAIYESEALPDPTSPTNENNNNNNNNMENRENVTYRERLGGYLHPRDMRRLVNPFSASNESEVIVRRHAILMNFDPLRAIILKDRLLVLVPDGADSILVQLEKRLRGGLETEKDMVDDSEVNGMENTQTNTDGDEPKPILDGASSEAETDDTSAENPKVDMGDDDPDFDDAADSVDAAQEMLDAFVEKEWNELEGRDWIDLPFELQSVDAVLSCVSQILADDVHELQLEANIMIVQLLEPGSDVGDHSQEVLRQMKNSVQEMMSRVDGYCRAMDELLEEDEDMALMNLSRLLTHPERFIQPVPQVILDEESDEPELILEAHLQRGHTLANALRLVQGQITSTEDYAERKSDTIRNQLLYINLLLQTMALAIAIGSFVGAIFGMNVLNGYEDSRKAFVIILCTTLTFMLCLPFIVIIIIRKMGVLPGKI